MKLVKCINTGRKDFLTLDKVYLVLEESSTAYLILGDFDCEVWVNKYWFAMNNCTQENEMSMKKVKLLHNFYSGLTTDKIYDVVDITHDGELYKIRNDSGKVGFYFSWRFEDIVENTSTEEKSTPSDIAELLVNKLFELGDEGDKKTNRIAFMVGGYGVDEESSGGMNKQALVKFFERILKESKNV